jgi:phosphomannomutase
MSRPATPIRFGTDGWRAVIAREFTFDNVRYCALGTAYYLRAAGLARRGLVVGYDTRFASEAFAAEVARVTTAAGIKTYLCNSPAPTPAVSYNIVHRRAGGGVVITASHNSAEWNGFKYKPDYAGSASPEVVASLEEEIAQAQTDSCVNTISLNEARQQGLLQMIAPARPYLKNIARLIDLQRISNAGISIGIDSMYGSGAGYLTRALGEGRTHVTELHDKPNPLFPGMERPEPIGANLGELSKLVRQGRLDVGIATDGDADRLGILDEYGQSITTLQVFSLLCLYQLEVLGERGTIVKSVTQSSMIDRLGELYGVPVITQRVGFKYLGPVMMQEDALAAGEESGGYAFRGNIPERDGILSGLMILDMMIRTGKRPSELVKWLYERVGSHHFDRWDLPFEEVQRQSIIDRVGRAKPDFLSKKRVQDIQTLDGYRFSLESGAWVLVRFSGTEPVIRLYAEAETPDSVRSLLSAVRDIAGV